MSKKKLKMTIGIDDEGIRKIMDATLKDDEGGKEKRLKERAEILYEVIGEFFMSKRKRSIYRETIFVQLICMLLTYIETGDKKLLKAFYEGRENMVLAEALEDEGEEDEDEEDDDDDDE